MANINISEVGMEFSKSPVFACSLSDIGLIYDDKLANQVLSTAPNELMRPPADDGESRREARAVSPKCTEAAIGLLRPVIEQIFVGPQFELARSRWNLFGVNYYETDDRFSLHHDFEKPDEIAVVILSLSGVRKLQVHNGQSLELTADKIAFLDGRANPLHAAECTVGPSVSVVADVPNVHF